MIINKLNEILKLISYKSAIGDTNILVSNIELDSRNCKSDSLFVAIDGSNVDGHLYIDKAIANGAKIIVCNKLPDTVNEGIAYILVKDTSKALAQISNAYYNFPSKNMKMIGITGTNGKSTTVNLLFDLFNSLGKTCALLSTINNKIGTEIYKSTHTTPDAKSLNEFLYHAANKQCEYCFMEVSSHSIKQNRVFGIQFDIMAFSNITHDHLDYHITFEDYLHTKKRIFDELSNDSIAIINIDDRYSFDIIKDCKSNIIEISKVNKADYNIKVLESDFNGMLLNINNKSLYTKLIGEFNAYNILTVYTIAIQYFDEMDIATFISNIEGVKGRFEHKVYENGKVVIIDYAHTPDALKNVLKTIDKIKKKNNNLITVFGCGGDRDKEKRPIMGKIAIEYSNRVIITNDNPRTEEPSKIIEDIKKGIDNANKNKTLTITDRAEAIRTACTLAQKNDVILIAGKGHEDYQEINGERIFFDDYQVVEDFFININN